VSHTGPSWILYSSTPSWIYYVQVHDSFHLTSSTYQLLPIKSFNGSYS